MSEAAMGRIPEAVIQQVLDAVDIVDLVGEYLSLKKAGGHYKGLCPFHQEKTPSFTVNPAMQIYKCFGCGKGGNAVGFVMEAEGLGFPEAVRLLARRCGVAVPESRGEDAETRTVDEVLLQINRAALEHFRAHLRSALAAGEPLAGYLADRGLDRAQLERFQLGWAPDQWQLFHDLGRRLGFSEDMLISSGLVLRAEKGGRVYDRYRGRLIFPIRNVSGAVIGFGGRLIAGGEGQPKYINSPETRLYHKGRTLYGLYEAKNEIRRRRMVLLVEGYMDLIALHQAGFGHAVASLGTALTPEQALVLKRFAERVVFLYDGDGAGQAAMSRGAASLLEAGLDLRVGRLPEGEDPDDFIRSHGAPAMEALLEGAEDYFHYRTREYRRREEQATPAEFRDFVQGLAAAAARVEEPIGRHQLFQRIARSTGLPEAEIQRLAEEDQRRRQRQEQQERRGEVRSAAAFDFDETALDRNQRREKALFDLFLRAPGTRERICEELDLDLIGHALLREALRQALAAHSDEDSSVESWAHACGNDQIRRLALLALTEGDRAGDADEARDLLRGLELARLDARIRSIQEGFRRGESAGSDARNLRDEISQLLKRRAELTSGGAVG
jgi:DNA primase